MPERAVVVVLVVVEAAAAAAITATRDLRPENRRRRRRQQQLQRLAPGSLVSRTRARVEEHRRREEARAGSASGPLRALPSFFVPSPGTAALVPPPRPGPAAGRESPAAAAPRIAPSGGQRGGGGSLPALSAGHLGCGPSGADPLSLWTECRSNHVGIPSSPSDNEFATSNPFSVFPEASNTAS